METDQERKLRWAKIAELKKLERLEREKRLKQQQQPSTDTDSDTDSDTESDQSKKYHNNSPHKNNVILNDSNDSSDSDSDSDYDFEEEHRQRRIRIAKMKQLEKQQREQRLSTKHKRNESIKRQYTHNSDDENNNENTGINKLHRSQIAEMKRLERLDRKKRLKKTKNNNISKQSLSQPQKKQKQTYKRNISNKQIIENNEQKDNTINAQFYTLYDMVQLVTSPQIRGTQDQTVLLYTYCLYSTPKQLLKVIFDRLNNTSKNEKAQIKVMSLLRTWLKIENDFEQQEFKIYFKNELIVQTQHDTGLINLSRPILTQLCTGSKELSPRTRDRHISFAAAPVSKIKKISKTKSLNDIDFSQLNAIEIARQICMLEYDIFKKIKHEEFLKQKSTQPNIDKMTDWFNRLVVWTQVEILYQRQLTKRAKTIALMLKICHALEQYNNISSLCAIRAGLCSSSIHRLRKTWQNIPKKARETKDKIDELFKLGNGQKNLRDRVSIISQPAIPHLGLFLGDIVFIHDGNDTFKTYNNGEKKINWNKMKMLSDRIAWISMFQQSPFVFKTVPIICEYLQSRMKIVPEDFLYKLSREVEPPQKKT